MIKDVSNKPSFVATACYSARYDRRCGRAVDEALYSTRAYDTWRRHDHGPTSAVFHRLAALSALTKQDLRTHGPQGFVPHDRAIADGLAAGEIELVATSGTTGDRVTNVWYQPWWDAAEKASWRLNAHALKATTGGHREAILTSPWCAGFPCEHGYLSMQERTLGRFLYLCERSDPSLWPAAMMDRMVDELNRFRPSVLEANPSFLARLCRHIGRQGLRVRSPGIIILTYENPSILHCRQIRRVFDCAVASSYGSTEAGYVFMECQAGRMHQVTENCHVDFLPFARQHGGPKIGQILVTTFDNPWRSLVRFDVGDIVCLDADKPCACGRNEGLTLASVEGRTVNLTFTPEGCAVTPGRVGRALGEVPGLAEYQVIQTERCAYHLRFVVDRTNPGKVAGDARDALMAVYGPDAVVRPEQVEGIAPDPPGKYRQTRSLLHVEPDALLDPRFAPRAS